MTDKNISQEVSWVDKVFKRYKDTGNLIPTLQERVYSVLALQYAPGRTVIDIGCSIGIGSNILAREARFVWGIDFSKENIDFATKIFKRPNLDFALYDIEQDTTKTVAKFEVVVAMEIIEHLGDVDAGLRTIKSFFGNETIGFITAPNTGNPEIAKRDLENNLHVQHWNAGTFYELMINNFKMVTLFSAEKLDRFSQNETIDGNSTDQLIVAKVEGIK